MTHMSTESGYEKSVVDKREDEIELMKKMFSLDGYYNLKLKPAQLDTYSTGDLVGMVSAVVNEVKPDTIILPYRNDIHSDHRVTFDVCMSCTKTFRYAFIKKILMMEVLSETDFAIPQESFSPNYFTDITGYLDKKIEISSVFESEVFEHPFPRSAKSIEALGILRGSNIMAKSAEAFEVVKIIE